MKLSNVFNPRMYPAYARRISRVFNCYNKYARLSYSQTGEDLIIQSALKHLGIELPTYLDIGAHHPTYLSNTYLMYQKGARGVCVEPNPELARFIRTKRPRDTVLEVAVGSQKGTTKLHIVSDPLFSTTSSEQAEYFASESKHKITRTLDVPVVSLVEIIRTYFKSPPSVVSLDTEGTDLEILQNLDLSKDRPLVFCIETLTYDEKGSAQKISEIINVMLSRDYFVFGDTYLNTIFVDSLAWKESLSKRFKKVSR